jgi:hypothetical protein
MLLRLKALVELVNESFLFGWLGSCKRAVLAGANICAAHSEPSTVCKVHLVGLPCCIGTALLGSVVDAASLVLFRILYKVN